MIDPRTGQRTQLAVPPDAALNSIDGLAWQDGSLLAVQNSPYLHRVIRIRLGADGQSVASVSTVNARTPAEYSQTTAALVGSDLYVVGGAPAPNIYGGPGAAPRPQVWRIPLR
jgi:hypothetical protein